VALEPGVRQFDSSERYRNEKEVGDAMQEVLKEDVMKEISEGIETRQRSNSVVRTGVLGFIPRGR